MDVKRDVDIKGDTAVNGDAPNLILQRAGFYMERMRRND